MKTTLYDNNVSVYAHRVMDEVVGKPEFGDFWNGNKVIRVADVAEPYRGVVQQAAGDAPTLTGAELRSALWEGHDAIISEDKTFGIHTWHYSCWRSFGIGGNGIIEKHEQQRAASKSPMASRMLAMIEALRTED